MTRQRLFRTSIGLALVLTLISSSAMAGYRTIFVREGTTLAGQALPEGQLKLTWKTNGSKDEYIVRVMRGSRVIAEAKGRFEERERAERDGVLMKPNGNGTREIVGVRFARHNKVLVIGG